MRGQLLKIGDAFVYLEYAAGRPLDGIPNRILNVAPTQLDRLGDPSQVAYQRAANIVEAASQYPRIQPSQNVLRMPSKMHPGGGHCGRIQSKKRQPSQP